MTMIRDWTDSGTSETVYNEWRKRLDRSHVQQMIPDPNQQPWAPLHDTYDTFRDSVTMTISELYSIIKRQQEQIDFMSDFIKKEHGVDINDAIATARKIKEEKDRDADYQGHTD